MAEKGDKAKLCAMAVSYHDGTLGVGELSEMPAPPGASQTAAFTINVKALTTGEDLASMGQIIIDRALDIARGGDGRIKHRLTTGSGANGR